LDSTVKLQPILQWGKSGCLRNPEDWEAWNVISYLTSGGRFHCGGRVPAKAGHRVVTKIKESETVRGDWEVEASTEEKHKELRSRYTLRLPKKDEIDAAYINIELLRLYSCKTYPGTPNGHGVKFEHNRLKFGNFTEVPDIAGGWVTHVPNKYCNQGVRIGAFSGDVELYWDAEKK